MQSRHSNIKASNDVVLISYNAKVLKSIKCIMYPIMTYVTITVQHSSRLFKLMSY